MGHRDTTLKTKEETTYDALRELVLSGEMPIGQFLSQRRLAERVGCAVVTLRAALRQLENEGLIENVPRWGVRVPKETQDSLKDRYYVREVFEVEAVRQIVRHREVLDFARLEALAAECDFLAGEPSAAPSAFGTTHFAFHHHLVELSGSRALATSYARNSLKSVFLWNAVHVWQNEQPQHVRDHVQLVQILRTRTEEEAVETIIHHVRRGLADELAILSR